ncbi:MAG: FAD-dependent oxidoreductase, partial [Pseudomonas sp.]
MEKTTLIVIGNGMAGARLVERLCEQAADRFRILMIGDEAQPAYNRILLTPVLAGEKHFDDIVTHETSWYQRHSVTFMAGAAATEIDRKARRVRAGGQWLAYDHLVLATGSRPFMPPLPGATLRGIYGFRAQQDVENILDGHYAGQPAVVIGGGVLGVEAAAALAQRGMQVSLLH